MLVSIFPVLKLLTTAAILSGFQGLATLLPLPTPYPAEDMEVYPVSTWVNNPAHDSPACIEALPERR